MIIGIGIDIIEAKRIKNAIEKNKRFLTRVFTGKEIEYCESMHIPSLHYAARFSAKEAFIKAIGTGFRYGIKWTEIEVIKDELGKPEIVLYGKAKETFNNLGGKNINLSLSHSKEYGSAVVIIESF